MHALERFADPQSGNVVLGSRGARRFIPPFCFHSLRSAISLVTAETPHSGRRIKTERIQSLRAYATKLNHECGNDTCSLDERSLAIIGFDSTTAIRCPGNSTTDVPGNAQR
jgi:hypothetical protein